MTRAYYNEFDPGTAAWLRELIKRGLIADGEVDGRSIVDVRADDLRGFTQCHFFAGIGGWSYALRLAGWPDDKPVWTGSCPCPPFSQAGKGSECPSCGGKSCLAHPVVTAGWLCLDCGDEWRGDDRHLLPEFLRLIGECRPATVFGEQVASRDGRLWLYALRATVERVGYALGAADLCAAGLGSPHIRQRLFFVGKRLADADDAGSQGRRQSECERALECAAGTGGVAGGLANPMSAGRPGPTNGVWRDADWLYCRGGKWRPAIASHVGVSHGLPHDLVRSWDGGFQINQETEGLGDGQASEADTGEAVSFMPRADGAQEVQRQVGGFGSVRSPETLQSGLHGGGHGERSLRQSEPQPKEGAQNCKAAVRNLPRKGSAPRSSQGRGPFEQRRIELDDVVPVLPSQIALAILHGRQSDASALQALCGAICEAGAVPFSPVQVPAIWRSLGREDQDRIRVGFGHNWVSRSFSPLSQKESARVMRLRGYGNAIVPQVAAAFIEAAS